ncbi:hypothetical protein BaRGS_00025523 [Batillaria attramentaria]|uniref:Uncharacterized protein n=1 Tax=Batillaria attramentaria TaxID=370345 RepID=A0ABD0K840_9CAEN
MRVEAASPLYVCVCSHLYLENRSILLTVFCSTQPASGLDILDFKRIHCLKSDRGYHPLPSLCQSEENESSGYGRQLMQRLVGCRLAKSLKCKMVKREKVNIYSSTEGNSNIKRLPCYEIE